MPDPPGRVFLTGALGFIARALGERLRSNATDVRGVDLRADEALGVVEGDVTKRGPWERHAEGSDVVIHTAAVLGFTSRFEGFYDTNVVSARRAIDAAVAAGARRFVHLSSIVVFGVDFPDGADERHPVHPTGLPYTDTKIAAEQLVLQAHAAGEIDCTIVRPGDVYGPGSRPWAIEPMRAIKRGQLAVPEGVVSPVYVDNLVDGIVLASSHPDAAGQVFTITDGIGVPNAEFFSHHARLAGKGAPRTAPARLLKAGAWAADHAYHLRGQPNEMNPGAVEYLTRRGTYSIEKARRVLGYEPRVSLEEGLRRTMDWLRAEGHA